MTTNNVIYATWVELLQIALWEYVVICRIRSSEVLFDWRSQVTLDISQSSKVQYILKLDG